MLRSCWKYLLLPLSSIIIFSGCAEKPAIIKGTITDENGNSLAGAAVFSVPQRYSTLSDTLGNFTMEGVEAGQYSLLAKLGNDSSLVNLGTIEPGQVLITTVVIKKIPPPPPPEPKVETPKEQPKPKPKEQPFVDPIYAEGAKVLLLADKDFFKKFEVESSDGLVWELRDIKTSKISFEGAKMYEGYYAGPAAKYYEAAARRCIYDGKLWIYTHGPEPVPEGGREIYIAIPLDLPGNADIDSVVAYFGFPKFPANATPGSVRFRIVGETTSGGISVLIDWDKIDHSSSGSFYHKSVQTLGDNRKIEYISLEINSDGDAQWDDFLIRPLVYFTMH
jgi:hypothetical protein